MILVALVDVLFTVDASEQDHIDLLVDHHIEFSHELFNSFNVSDIARQFSVLKWQTGFFAK